MSCSVSGCSSLDDPEAFSSEVFEVTNTCFRLRVEGLTTIVGGLATMVVEVVPTVVDDELEIIEVDGLGACKTRTTLFDWGALLKIAAVTLGFVSEMVAVVVVIASTVVIGVIVTPLSLTLGGSRFCGGSGISPDKLAKISATFLRSVWLFVGLAVIVVDGDDSQIRIGLSILLVEVDEIGDEPCSGFKTTIFWPCLRGCP